MTWDYKPLELCFIYCLLDHIYDNLDKSSSHVVNQRVSNVKSLVLRLLFCECPNSAIKTKIEGTLKYGILTIYIFVWPQLYKLALNYPLQPAFSALLRLTHISVWSPPAHAHNVFIKLNNWSVMCVSDNQTLSRRSM